MSDPEIARSKQVAKQILKAFSAKGDFRPRDALESNKGRIQALPVVVVRNKSGDVLRLRRQERSEENPLNEKIVIWAGGHVRKEDEANGASVIQGAVRELQEELRLFVEPDELKLLGAVYRDEGNEHPSMLRLFMSGVPKQTT